MRGLIIRSPWIEKILAGKKDVGDPWVTDKRSQTGCFDPGWKRRRLKGLS